jgi:ribosomal protein S18 acetylase RimI-like enzyme
VTIRALTTKEVLGSYRREIAEVWTWVDSHRLNEILPTHAGREGFRFRAALADDGRLLGFAYGYLGSSGQWWHDLVAAAMSRADQSRWLARGHFELVELHVHQDARRRGIGGRLHDAILAGLPSPTAVLSTQTDNEPALALYRSRGWQILVPELHFQAGGRPYAILGRDLH